MPAPPPLRIHTGYVPAGIKFAPEAGGAYPVAETFKGISFCAAVHQATEGMGRSLLLEPDSFDVCRWAPVVLGFREDRRNFDLDVAYFLPPPVSTILLAPLPAFREDAPPDVVLIRATRTEIAALLAEAGPENLCAELAGRLDLSALEIFLAQNNAIRHLRVEWTNRLLASLNRSPQWRDFTKVLFKRHWTTYLFNQLLKRYMANMSLCRNSAVVPYLTGKINVSYFCTGGICWGENRPEHLTCGIPYALAGRFEWIY